jgi:hypothetical protein
MTKVLRSKSAGPYKVTIDLFFDSDSMYERVKNSGMLTREVVAKLYNMRPEDVEGIYCVDLARGIKITIPKAKGEGTADPGCRDIYGAQQYVPLLDIEIP